MPAGQVRGIKHRSGPGIDGTGRDEADASDLYVGLGLANGVDGGAHAGEGFVSRAACMHGSARLVQDFALRVDQSGSDLGAADIHSDVYVRRVGHASSWQP